MKNNRRSYISGLAAFLIMLAGSAPAFSQRAAEIRVQIAHIQTLVKQNHGKWVAGQTSLSNLSMKEWQMRVGPDFEAPNAPALELPAATPPASLDWRNSNGSYVTGIRDQGQCGSCWAFSLTGGLESYVLITSSRPGADIDLSEQVMLSCSGEGSCKGGHMHAGYLQSTGLPLETVYPYTATNGACSSASAGWQSSAYKIYMWDSVPKDLSIIKATLAALGPLPTTFTVYEDFMHYKSGIYSYITGKKLGAHAVLLVGYNDAENYFIVKNSWGTGWGENGFFRIAYSEMDGKPKFGKNTIRYIAGGGSPQDDDSDHKNRGRQ